MEPDPEIAQLRERVSRLEAIVAALQAAQPAVSPAPPPLPDEASNLEPPPIPASRRTHG